MGEGREGVVSAKKAGSNWDLEDSPTPSTRPNTLLPSAFHHYPSSAQR